MTACAGYYAVLHTQEVTGSSPAVSTKKFLISSEIRNFFAYMARNRDAFFLRFSFDPNADPKAEMTGVERIASSAPLPTIFLWLHGLADDAADGVGGGALHPLRGVGVGAEGKARVIVSQRTGQRLDVHTVLEGQRGEGVPLRYNYDKPEKPRTSRVFGYLARFFILFQTEKSSRELVIS